MTPFLLEAYHRLKKFGFWITDKENVWLKVFRILNIGLLIGLIRLGVVVIRLDDELLNANHKIALLENDVRDNKIEAYEFNSLIQSLNDSPIPQYSKKATRNDRFVYRWFNKAFEDKVLKPRGIEPYDVLGKSDYELWPIKTAREAERVDSIVYATRQKYRGFISFPDSTGVMTKWRLSKHPAFYREDLIFLSAIIFKDSI